MGEPDSSIDSSQRTPDADYCNASLSLRYLRPSIQLYHDPRPRHQSRQPGTDRRDLPSWNKQHNLRLADQHLSYTADLGWPIRDSITPNQCQRIKRQVRGDRDRAGPRFEPVLDGREPWILISRDIYL